MCVQVIRAIYAVVRVVEYLPAGKRLPWFPVSDASMAEQRSPGALWLCAVGHLRCYLLSE